MTIRLISTSIVTVIAVLLSACDNRMAVRLGGSEMRDPAGEPSSYVTLVEDNSSMRPDGFTDAPAHSDEKGAEEAEAEGTDNKPPQPEAEAAPEPPEEPEGPSPEEQLKELTQPIYFRLDDYSLNAQHQEQLASLAQLLNTDDFRDNMVRIEGHCDDRGTREYNFALGAARANAILSVLVSNGVSKSRIKTISYGKERPRYQGQTPLSRARNRRGDILIK